MQIGGCGCCDRLRLAAGVARAGSTARRSRRLLVSRPVDDLEALVEAVEALREVGANVDPVRVGLLLVPPGAQAELEATARDDVERRGHVREHRGVAVAACR